MLAASELRLQKSLKIRFLVCMFAQKTLFQQLADAARTGGRIFTAGSFLVGVMSPADHRYRMSCKAGKGLLISSETPKPAGKSRLIAMMKFIAPNRNNLQSPPGSHGLQAEPGGVLLTKNTFGGVTNKSREATRIPGPLHARSRSYDGPCVLMSSLATLCRR